MRTCKILNRLEVRQKFRSARRSLSRPPLPQLLNFNIDYLVTACPECSETSAVKYFCKKSTISDDEIRRSVTRSLSVKFFNLKIVKILLTFEYGTSEIRPMPNTEWMQVPISDTILRSKLELTSLDHFIYFFIKQSRLVPLKKQFLFWRFHSPDSVWKWN